MRETVEVSRRLLAMERVTFHGEFVNVDDIEIDIVHGDRSPKDVPIYIGATGMKMMELAGEIADGVVLNYLVEPGVQRGSDGAPRGRRRAGRPDGRGHRPPAAVVCSLDEDREVALDRARELVTQYLGQQPHIMKASGVDPALLEEIGRGPHLAGRTGGDPRGDGARARRRGPDDHGLGNAGGVPGEGARVRRRRAARARSCIRSATTSVSMIDAFAEGSDAIGRDVPRLRRP